MNIIEWRVSGTGQLTKTNWSIPPSPRHYSLLTIHCRLRAYRFAAFSSAGA